MAVVDGPINESGSSGTTAVGVRPARWPGWVLRGLELGGLLAIAGYLAYDRWLLFHQYLMKYVDEDQAIEWYAARELLRGRLHEPCFFGQSYNSNLEGYLAAPLIWAKVPFEVAVPLVSLLLGLLPYLMVAVAAWWRKMPVVAGLALLVPLAMSTRFGIITGMPRGFVTGIAVGAIPAVLFLPAWRRRVAKKPRAKEKGETPVVPIVAPAVQSRAPGEAPPLEIVEKVEKPKLAKLRRSWPITRYFFGALLAVVAVTLNPNAGVLLVPVAVFALLTSFLEWRFWLFGILGSVVGGLYPYLVYKFYFVWHDDYRLYLRERTFTWSYENFQHFIPKLDDAFHDLVPEGVYDLSQQGVEWVHVKYPALLPTWALHSPASAALAVMFILAFVLLVLRVRVAAAFATLTGVGLTVFAMAYDRLQNSKTSVSFPYARMYLAVPVLLVWLLLLLKRPEVVKGEQKLAIGVRSWLRAARAWGMPAVRMALIGAMIWAGRHAALAKAAALNDELADLVENADTARPMELAEGLRVAKVIQKIADAQHIKFVLIVGYEGRRWDYLLPELTTCETLFPSYERRTWRLAEECYPRYDKIMVLGGLNRPVKPKQFPSSPGSGEPPIRVYSLNGRSVDDFCRMNYVRVREFVRPAGAPPATRPG